MYRIVVLAIKYVRCAIPTLGLLRFLQGPRRKEYSF